MAIVDTLQVVLELAADKAIASLRAFDKQLSFAHSSFKKFASDISIQSQISSAAFLKGFAGITDWLTGASPTFQAYMDAVGFEFTALGETIAADVQPALDTLIDSLDTLIGIYEGLPEPIRKTTSLLITLGVALGVVSAVVTLLAPVFSSMAGAVSAVTGAFGAISTMLAYESALSGIEVVSFGAEAATVSLSVALGIIAVALALVAGAAIGLKDAFDKNLGWALLVVESFSAGVGAMFLGLSQLVGGIWLALTSLLTGNTQGFIDGIQSIVRGLITFLLGAVLTAASIISGFFLGLGTTLKNILTVFWDIGSGIVGAIVQGILDNGGKVLSAILKLIPSSLSSTVSSALGISSTIPAMAEGGIVTKPTVALIGERGPEAVVPLGQAGGMGNFTIGPIYISGSMNSDADLQDLARRLTQYMHQEMSAISLAYGTKR